MDKIYLLIRNCDNGERYEEHDYWDVPILASSDKAKLIEFVGDEVKWLHLDEDGYYDITDKVKVTEENYPELNEEWCSWFQYIIKEVEMI